MKFKDFTISHHTRKSHSGVIEELIYEDGDIRFMFTTDSYVLDPQDVVSDVLCLNFRIEKKLKGEYVTLEKQVELDKWENHMSMVSLHQPLSWENNCKKVIYLLIKSYSQFNKKGSLPTEDYYRERISKLGPLSYRNPISNWNDSDLSLMKESFIAAENKNHKLIDLLINHKVINFKARAQQDQFSFGDINFKVRAPQRRFSFGETSTTIGNIILQYVSNYRSEPDQIDPNCEITLNVYLKKEEKNELLYSINNYIKFSYASRLSPAENYNTYVELIAEHEFSLLCQLDLNRSKNLEKYLEKYFRSQTN